MKIKNIVFDVGQVLFEYNPQNIIDKMCPKTAYKDEYLKILFMDSLWQALDRGDLSEEQAKEQLAKEVAYHPQKKEELFYLFDNWVPYLNKIEGTVKMFNKLVLKFPVYILSNFQDKRFDDLLKLHPFMKQARGIVVSAKVKMMKPEKDIYLYLLNKYKLIPEETMFIDDRPENIEACEKVGMSGILFVSSDQLKQDFVKKGIVL
jgi:putative hydrolase of the HAD superfamily